MASCEKCWKEAKGDAERYKQLIGIRNCTLEEQAGEDAEICPICKNRTIHQIIHECLKCGYKKK